MSSNLTIDVTTSTSPKHDRKKAKTVQRSTNWVWTLNNPTEEERAKIDQLVTTGQAAYVTYGVESGNTGTRHLQGYAEFALRKTITTVKSLIGHRGHYEIRRGTQAQAIEYCHKDGDFKEFGIKAVNNSGKRTDLDLIAERIAAGTSLRVIAQEFPTQWVRYHNGIRSLATQLQPRHITCHFGPYKWSYPDNITSICFWGPSGIGKTEFAKFLMPRALFVTHMDALSQYDAQEYDGIIFDDMSFKHLPRESQIHLLDYDNDRMIHVRYLTAFIPAGTRKIFTCNDWAAMFIQNDPAIDRRLTYIRLE